MFSTRWSIGTILGGLPGLARATAPKRFTAVSSKVRTQRTNGSSRAGGAGGAPASITSCRDPSLSLPRRLTRVRHHRATCVAVASGARCRCTPERPRRLAGDLARALPRAMPVCSSPGCSWLAVSACGRLASLLGSVPLLARRGRDVARNAAARSPV